MTNEGTQLHKYKITINLEVEEGVGPIFEIATYACSLKDALENVRSMIDVGYNTIETKRMKPYPSRSS